MLRHATGRYVVRLFLAKLGEKRSSPERSFRTYTARSSMSTGSSVRERQEQRKARALALGALDLAHAFLLRGDYYVVGATAKTDGELARRFAKVFYEELMPSEGQDVPGAWHRAYPQVLNDLPSSLNPQLRLLPLYSRQVRGVRV